MGLSVQGMSSLRSAVRSNGKELRRIARLLERLVENQEGENDE